MKETEKGSSYDTLKQAFRSKSYISEEDWQYVRSQLGIRQFSKNDYYLNAGETERRIGFITRGSFKWYYINNKGEEINFYFFFDNDFVVDFGSFLTQTPSRQYIRAMEDSEVILLPEYEKIIEAYEFSHKWSEFGRKIAESVYLISSNRVQDLLFKSAEERYLQLLEEHPDILRRVSLSNIASFLGIQGPSLSRIRKRISKR
ncbi:MAG: cyclic nucleotide-binding domain-containing protein [Bacteroidales bacterium]|jgi:CRP-like cAMP-binding protein|nr:cyclic nucleotide-binding domain-containing protein [Bacteroidales bacterium]